MRQGTLRRRMPSNHAAGETGNDIRHSENLEFAIQINLLARLQLQTANRQLYGDHPDNHNRGEFGCLTDNQRPVHLLKVSETDQTDQRAVSKRPQ